VQSVNGHPFTGMFLEGDHGIIRMSLAGKPTISTKDPTKNLMVPAIGLKFLRDGMESANIVGINTVAG
jgi:hypothetical protein